MPPAETDSVLYLSREDVVTVDKHLCGLLADSHLGGTQTVHGVVFTREPGSLGWNRGCGYPHGDRMPVEPTCSDQMSLIWRHRTHENGPGYFLSIGFDR